VLGGSWRRGYREEGALMCLGVANQTRDVVVLQQCIGEYLGRGEARASSDGCRGKAGRMGVLQLGNGRGAERDLLEVSIEQRHDGHGEGRSERAGARGQKPE
jgi:hypothetical protein